MLFIHKLDRTSAMLRFSIIVHIEVHLSVIEGEIDYIWMISTPLVVA